MSDNMPTIIVEARTRVIVRAVFFSCILYDKCRLIVLKPGESSWCGVPCPTGMTDGKNVILNYDFMAGLKSVGRRAFVICHEVYHVMAMHPARMRKYAVEGLYGLPFLPQLYNILADAVINKQLVDSNIGERPEGCVWITKIGNYAITGLETPEELYKKMLDELPPQVRQQLATLGSSSAETKEIDGNAASRVGGDARSMTNDVIPSSPDKEAMNVNEAEMKAAVQSAAIQAKTQGTMPAGLKRFIDEFLEPQIKWTEKLRLTVVSKTGRDRSDWSRANRHKLVTGIYIPRRRGLRMGPIATMEDTSGSVSEKERKQYYGELASILGDVHPEKLYHLWCDARVDGMAELQDPEELKHLARTGVVTGGGGTSFIPPFLYLDEHEIDVDTVIYFTDGFGPFPSKEQIGGR